MKKKTFKKTLLNHWISAATLTIVFQLLLTGYVQKHPSITSKSTSATHNMSSRSYNACQESRLLTMSDRSKNRILAICEGTNCLNRSIKIKLNKDALFQISNAVHYSHKSTHKTLLNTMFHLMDRPSGYMIGQGVQARIILTPDFKTLVGDVFNEREVRFSDGKSLNVAGEIWRECDSLNQLSKTLTLTLRELELKGPKNLSSMKYLKKLNSEILQAKAISESWKSTKTVSQ